MNWLTNDAATEPTEADERPYPSDDEIMEIVGLTSSSTHQFCDRLRDLFAGIDYFAQDRTAQPTQYKGVLEQMQQQVYEVNQANGWFDDERTVGDDIALLHTEVSEMFEAFRSDGLADATVVENITEARPLPKPEGFGSECADVLIRLLDTCQRRGVDLRYEFKRKLAFNRTRGHMHGGKRI